VLSGCGRTFRLLSQQVPVPLNKRNETSNVPRLGALEKDPTKRP
jgi:hypothetical protein